MPAKPLKQDGILPKIMSADLVILELSDDVIYRTDSGDLEYVTYRTYSRDLEYTFTTMLLNSLANGVSQN